MKIPLSSNVAVSHSRHRQGGMAVIIVLALLSIILIYISANIRSLYRLDRELKLTNERQIHRLAAASRGAAPSMATTNAPLLHETGSTLPEHRP